MITAIEIENFKAIGTPGVRVELKPLTLIFGPNSAGKSTILQAIHYAQEIFERLNLDPDRTVSGGEALDLGGFESFVHNHDVKLPIRLRFELDLKDQSLPYYGEENPLWELNDECSDAASVMFNRCTSAWVEIMVRSVGVAVLLTQYEVGLNGQFVARTRVRSTDEAEIDEIDFAHPMLAAGKRAFQGDFDIERPFRSLGDLFRATVGRDLASREGRLGIQFGRQCDQCGLASAFPCWGEVISTDAFSDDEQKAGGHEYWGPPKLPAICPKPP